MTTLQIAQVPTKKYGWTFYWYDSVYGLSQYTQREITDMVKDGFKIEIVDSLDALISEGLK